MASNIDVTKPESGNATTESVRDNFAFAKEEIENLQATKLDSSAVGFSVAPLDESGKVPAINLPSYVDSLDEYPSLSEFPNPGTSGTIYVALDTAKTYRWGGSVYAEISPSEVNSVQGRTGSVVLDKDDIGLGNVDNTSDANKPISNATLAALSDKQDTLVSSENIKTINSQSILGEGDIEIAADLSVTQSTYTVYINNTLGTQAEIPQATTTFAGAFSAPNKVKLDGIQAGATANSTDAQLRDRATHTGTQSTSTISGLDTYIDSRVEPLLDDKKNLPQYVPVMAETTVSQSNNGNVFVLDDGVTLIIGDGLVNFECTVVAKTGGLLSATGTVQFTVNGEVKTSYDLPDNSVFDIVQTGVNEYALKVSSAGGAVQSNWVTVTESFTLSNADIGKKFNFLADWDVGYEELTITIPVGLDPNFECTFRTDGRKAHNIVFEDYDLQYFNQSTTDPNSTELPLGITKLMRIADYVEDEEYTYEQYFMDIDVTYRELYDPSTNSLLPNNLRLSLDGYPTLAIKMNDVKGANVIHLSSDSPSQYKTLSYHPSGSFVILDDGYYSYDETSNELSLRYLNGKFYTVSSKDQYRCYTDSWPYYNFLINGRAVPSPVGNWRLEIPSGTAEFKTIKDGRLVYVDGSYEDNDQNNPDHYGLVEITTDNDYIILKSDAYVDVSYYGFNWRVEDDDCVINIIAPKYDFSTLLDVKGNNLILDLNYVGTNVVLLDGEAVTNKASVELDSGIQYCLQYTIANFTWNIISNVDSVNYKLITSNHTISEADDGKILYVPQYISSAINFTFPSSVPVGLKFSIDNRSYQATYSPQESPQVIISDNNPRGGEALYGNGSSQNYPALEGKLDFTVIKTPTVDSNWAEYSTDTRNVMYALSSDSKDNGSNPDGHISDYTPIVCGTNFGDFGERYIWASDIKDYVLSSGGLGNVTGPASTTNGQLATFSGTTGKVIANSTLTGILKTASGVPSAAVAGTDYVVPSGSITGNAATATALATARTLTIGSSGKTFNGTANVSWSLTEIGAQPVDADLTSIAGLTGTSGLLRKTGSNTWSLDTAIYLTSTGVSANTYTKVTVSSNGLVTAGSNPTTLAEYGITDALTPDSINTYTKAQRGTFVQLTIDDVYIMPDLEEGNFFMVAFTAPNSNYVMDNPIGLPPEGVTQSGSIFFYHQTDGAVLAFGSSYKWAGGTPGTLTSLNGTVDRLDYVVSPDGSIHCSLAKDIK